MKHGPASLILSLVALALLLAAPRPASAQQPGSLLIWPVNPVIEGDARAAALWLENPGKTPITLQVRIFAWAQQNSDNVYAPQNDVVGTPPIVSIAPGERQLIRLTRTTPPPDVAEKPYRIVVDEIPTGKVSAAPGASVSFRMRYSLPLFSYAQRGDSKARPTAPAPQISWRTSADNGERFLEIRNTGASHARLTDVSFTAGPNKQPVAQGLLGYVLPGATMRWPLPRDIDITGELVATVNGTAGIPVTRRQE